MSEIKNKFLNFFFELGVVMNKWRLFPRLYTILFGYTMYLVVKWYLGEEAPSAEQTAFATAFVATAAAFFKFYVGSGPNTNAKTNEDE